MHYLPDGSKQCPTGQNAVSQQLIEVYYQNFTIYSDRIFQQSLKI